MRSVEKCMQQAQKFLSASSVERVKAKQNKKKLKQNNTKQWLPLKITTSSQFHEFKLFDITWSCGRLLLFRFPFRSFRLGAFLCCKKKPRLKEPRMRVSATRSHRVVVDDILVWYFNCNFKNYWVACGFSCCCLIFFLLLRFFFNHF